MPRDPKTSVTALLTHYSFDLDGYSAEKVVQAWLEEYSPKWVIAAVVEAIFQGRYKSASVDNILLNWYLNGKPQHHFDSEFADLVCSKIFKAIPTEPPPSKPPEKSFVTILDVPTPKAAVEPQKEPYSLTQVGSASKALNKGIGQHLKFITKL